jgi:hypothetical protein
MMCLKGSMDSLEGKIEEQRLGDVVVLDDCSGSLQQQIR